MLNLTLYMCAENVHIANINVPAGVGAPLLNTQLQITAVQKIDLCIIQERIRTGD